MKAGFLQLTIDIPENAQRVIAVLEAASFEAYLVGGCVRDAVMGLVPGDFDITTNARPEQVKLHMQRAGLHTFDTGIAHGTVTVRCGGESFEVTTYRSDGAYEDARHPSKVTYLESVGDDLARRDFTINALAYNCKTGLVDCFDGLQDLENRTLRCVGVAHERFDEDALRIMRGLRFSATLGFRIEAKTSAAIHEDAHLLAHISTERIWVELSKLLCGQHCVEVLREYRDVLAVIIPEIVPEFDFDQHNPYHKYDVWEHTLHALQAAPHDMDAVARFALLMHDIGKPGCLTFDEDGIGHMHGHDKAGEPLAREVCTRLHLSNEEKQRVVHLVRWHMFTIPDTTKSMRRFLRKHGIAAAQDLLAIRRCDIAGFGHEVSSTAPLSVAFAKAQRIMEEQLAQKPPVCVKDLAINGHDLIEAGFKPGPELGRILNALLEEVVDEKTENSREALLQRASNV